MQDIEKLARSVFENAEQEPPKEVWDGIEAKLHNGVNAKKVRVRKSLWATAAGTVVAGAILFGLTRKPSVEPVLQAALIDTLPEVVVADEPALATEVQHEETVVASRVMEERKTAPQPSNNPQTSALVSVSNDEEEQIFDLLEYQLSSHEYDIPAGEQATSAPQQKRESVKRPASTAKEDGKTSKTKSSVEIDMVIPNLLTPNGDGYNDCWQIPDLKRYGRASVQIFTAQSMRVFTSDNYNGDFCGDDLPSGNYFYVLTIREHNYTRRGVLVIKR